MKKNLGNQSFIDRRTKYRWSWNALDSAVCLDIGILHLGHKNILLFKKKLYKNPYIQMYAIMFRTYWMHFRKCIRVHRQSGSYFSIKIFCAYGMFICLGLFNLWRKEDTSNSRIRINNEKITLFPWEYFTNWVSTHPDIEIKTSRKWIQVTN